MSSARIEIHQSFADGTIFVRYLVRL